MLDFSGDAEGGFNAADMARADIAAGHYNILTGGMNRWRGEPTKAMKAKYGVIVMDIAGCTDGKAIFAIMDAYNDVSKPAIKAKYGQSVIDDVFEEASRKTAEKPATTASRN